MFAGKPCTLGEQCDTFSPFGEPYRDGGLPAVFIFAVLFGLFWRVAWLYFSRHRDTVVALVGYATLLPFMITWMRGNFTLPALQATLALGRRRPRGDPVSPARRAAPVPLPRTESRAGRLRAPRLTVGMWPNLFLVGAAKAGTTSVYDELARHPAIYMSPMKEPHYFSRIQPSPERAAFFPHVTDEDEYMALFDGVTEERLVGEASTSYLWDASAAERIQSVAPEASILIMLRNPVERAYSQYWNDVREGIEARSLHRCPRRGTAFGPGRMGGHLPVHRLWAIREPGRSGTWSGSASGYSSRSSRTSSPTKRARSRTSRRSWAWSPLAARRATSRMNPTALPRNVLSGRAARERQAADARPGHGAAGPASSGAGSAAQGGQPAADGSRKLVRCWSRSSVLRWLGWPSCSAGSRPGSSASPSALLGQFVEDGAVIAPEGVGAKLPARVASHQVERHRHVVDVDHRRQVAEANRGSHQRHRPLPGCGRRRPAARLAERSGAGSRGPGVAPPWRSRAPRSCAVRPSRPPVEGPATSGGRRRRASRRRPPRCRSS